MQIQSSANLLEQSSFNQQRGRSRYKSSTKTQEVSMEEIDQAKDQEKCGRDTDRKQRDIRNNTEEKWEEVVQVFRENKR